MALEEEGIGTNREMSKIVQVLKLDTSVVGTEGLVGART